MRLDQSLALVMSIIESRPDGIEARELAEAVSRSFARVKDYLHLLRDRGLVGCTGSGHSARWATPMRAAELRAKQPAKRVRGKAKPAPAVEIDAVVQVIRPAGTWERKTLPSLLRRADIFEGLMP